MYSERPTTTERSPSLRKLVPRGQASDTADGKEGDERDGEEHDGDGRGARPVAAVDLVEDEDGRDLGLEREVARDEHDRADLPDGTGEREGDPGQDPGEDVGQDHAAEDGQLAGAERAGSLLHLSVELVQDRLHRP